MLHGLINLENMCSRNPIKKPSRIFLFHPSIKCCNSLTAVQNRVPIIIMHTYQIHKNMLTEKNHTGMVRICKTHVYFWYPPLLLLMSSFHLSTSTQFVKHFESFLTLSNISRAFLLSRTRLSKTAVVNDFHPKFGSKIRFSHPGRKPPRN